MKKVGVSFFFQMYINVNYILKCTTFADYHMYQYFVQVVPTDVKTRLSQVDTYQYAVTERVSNGSINLMSGKSNILCEF